MSGVSGLVQIVEAALLAAARPLSVAQLGALFEAHERPAKEDLRQALAEVRERCADRGYELIEVASGFRFQVREALSPWVGRLWQERPQKYSRAALETLALIAYRQPITRGEIEEIRGVAVGAPIIRSLNERDWIRVVGHRDVPGRPALYATTNQFLDYFNLKSLDQLPALADRRDLQTLNAELGFSEPVPAAPGEAGPGPDAESESDAEREAGVESGPGVESESGAESGPGAESELGAERAPGVESGPGAESGPDAESGPGAESELGAERAPGEEQSAPGPAGDHEQDA